MKKGIFKIRFRKTALIASLAFTAFGASAQTNVFDDVIAMSPDHTSLTVALEQEGLDLVLQDMNGTFTVFAPDNAAFDALAVALNTDIPGLLALPILADVLKYHVLGLSAPSSGIMNGDIVTPVNMANTIKLTKTVGGEVYANQAMVIGADLPATNGYVHSINSVLLPYETVVDVAIDAGFTTLTTAVVTAELLPALTNPLASLTVFAPDNTAFDNLVAAMGINLTDLLAMPELADILLYHVVAGTVMSTDLTNGSVPTLNGQNVEVDLTMGVMINLSNVTSPDITAANGVVHVIDAVLVPNLVGVEEVKMENLMVSPNPTSNVLNFSKSLNGTYEVINIYGVVVKSGTSKNGNIDVSELAKGNYFVRMTSNSVVSQGKFIKN